MTFDQEPWRDRVTFPNTEPDLASLARGVGASGSAYAQGMETGRAPRGKGEIALYLTLDEALVLGAFLERGDWTGEGNSAIKDQAELRVLWTSGLCSSSSCPS